jgi:hypothetical protein
MDADLNKKSAFLIRFSRFFIFDTSIEHWMPKRELQYLQLTRRARSANRGAATAMLEYAFPGGQTAIGALIGAVGAVAGGAFGSWFTWQKERQSVAAAFAAEVQGVLGYLEWDQSCKDLLDGRRFLVGDLHFPVFEANVGKIGLLPSDCAAKVAGFYNYAESIFQDFRLIYKDEIPRESERAFTERLAKKIKTMLKRGDALVSELQKEAKKTWKDYLQPG